MISWLLIIILAYFFFSLSFLGDKLILSGLPKPGFYTFYVGALGIFVIFLIPFVRFNFPDVSSITWIILEAIVYLIGLYAMFVAISKFEVSKVMTTIGATQPVFILLLTWLFWGFQVISKIEILAFILLLTGSIVISFEKAGNKNKGYLKITILSSLMFSLDYVFSKFVFLGQPFWQGLIWMRIFSFLFVLFFLFSKNLRKEIFVKKRNLAFDKKIGTIFVCSQTCGGIANGLQSFAIFLVPIAFLPIINSLKGTQYVFLFLMTLFFSLFFPKILKEEMSKKNIIKKAVSILLITAGLAIIVLY